MWRRANISEAVKAMTFVMFQILQNLMQASSFKQLPKQRIRHYLVQCFVASNDVFTDDHDHLQILVKTKHYTNFCAQFSKIYT